jgi:hypothetical protein
MQSLSYALRAGIVAVWVLLVVSLARQPEPAPDTRMRSDVPVSTSEDSEEIWMGVYLGDKKIGYSSYRFVPSRGGYDFEQRSVLRLSVLKKEQTVVASVRGTAGSDDSLQRFEASLRSGVGNLEVNGAVEGKQLHLTLNVGSEQTAQQISLDEPIFLPGSAHRSLVRRFEVGREYTLSVFDPSAMQHRPMRVRVEALESIAADQGSVTAWRVKEEIGGVVATVWLDQKGHVLREQGPMGLTTVRQSAAEAVTGWDRSTAVELMNAVAIPVNGEIASPRQLDRLRVRLRGTSDVAPPSDQRQQYENGVLTVLRERQNVGSTYVLPYDGTQWRGELSAAPLLQVDHPRVRSTAEQALGGETDSVRAAERLRGWVFQHLKKVPTASIPNALQVLEMREGDCNEHAVLFASLARAVGLPARMVAGTVYMDGVFLYHAWNEVWLGSGWMSVDAALNQMPVDATHIKLIEGGPEQHAMLLPVIGRLSIDVLDADRDG